MATGKRKNPFAVTSKDIILSIIKKIGTDGGTGHVLEYRGDAIRDLSMEQRMTICNMSIEAGSRAGLIAPDEKTFEYIKNREFTPQGDNWNKAMEYWSTLKSDENAFFDKELVFDGNRIQPMITYGTNPGMGMSISNYGTKMQMSGRDMILQTEVDPSLESDPTNINANYATDRFDLPLIFRFGLAYKKILTNNLNLLIAADALHPNDNTESLNLGAELVFKDFVYLRSGREHLFQRDSEAGFALGGGVKLTIGKTHYTIDYTYAICFWVYFPCTTQT